MRFKNLMLGAVSCLFASSGAVAWASTSLLDGRSLTEVSLGQALSNVQLGSVLIVSELHDHAAHHQNQRDALSALADRLGKGISVGLEFFERQHQEKVDQYVKGELAEPDFLKAIGWGSNPYEFYRDQALFPAAHGGKTVALNAARTLTSKVSKSGISSLSADEKAALPPDFVLGNTLYLERFREAMGDHVPAEAIQRYFEAQSIWDDTMAWTAATFLAQNPQQVLVVLVGDFHAAYGGGLPDRLRARGVGSVHVISQVDLTGASEEEKRETLEPHPRYGQRGDFIWVQQE